MGLLVYLFPQTFILSGFPIFWQYHEHTQWKLFQKHVVHTQLESMVFFCYHWSTSLKTRYDYNLTIMESPKLTTGLKNKSKATFEIEQCWIFAVLWWPFWKWRPVEIFRCQESIRDIIIYPRMKCLWNWTMLNLCGIVVAILKMVTGRKFFNVRNQFGT